MDVGEVHAIKRRPKKDPLRHRPPALQNATADFRTENPQNEGSTCYVFVMEVSWRVCDSVWRNFVFESCILLCGSALRGAVKAWPEERSRRGQ